MYDKVPGDGREFVVTDPGAVTVRAEDGRSVSGVDISPFISSLPTSAAAAAAAAAAAKADAKKVNTVAIAATTVDTTSTVAAAGATMLGGASKKPGSRDRIAVDRLKAVGVASVPGTSTKDHCDAAKAVDPAAATTVVSTAATVGAAAAVGASAPAAAVAMETPSTGATLNNGGTEKTGGGATSDGDGGSAVTTECFSTQGASGSTSQAANVVEALEAGATALLLDEDTCAGNVRRGPTGRPSVGTATLTVRRDIKSFACAAR